MGRTRWLVGLCLLGTACGGSDSTPLGETSASAGGGAGRTGDSGAGQRGAGMSGSSGYSGATGPGVAGTAGAAGEPGAAGTAGSTGGSGAAGGACVVAGDDPPLCWHGACLLTPRGTTDRTLRSLWAAGPSDVWGVGYHGRIERWTGQSWSTHESGTTMYLRSVVGTAPDDVWAGGTEGLLRFDGASWTLVDSDPVASVATRDGWVWVLREDDAVSVWDGSSWDAIEPVPHEYGQFKPERLQAGGADDLWVKSSGCVGIVAGQCGIYGWYTHHWDGSSWAFQQGPTGSLIDTLPRGPGDVWALRSGSSSQPPMLVHGGQGSWVTIGAASPPSLLRAIGPDVVVGPDVVSNGSLVTALPGWPGPTGDWFDLAGASLADVWTAGRPGRAHFQCGSWALEETAWGPSIAGALSRDDVWGLEPASPENPYQELVVKHWDGLSWSTDPGLGSSTFARKLSVAGDQVWIVLDKSTVSRRQDGVWTSFAAPGYLEDLVAVAPDEVWLVAGGDVWRGDGSTWEVIHAGTSQELTVADAQAIWIRDGSTLLFWDGQSLHDETALAFLPVYASRAADGSLVAFGSTMAGDPGEYSVRVHQGGGWSEPIAVPSGSRVRAMWARTAGDVWLWVSDDTDAYYKSDAGHVMHLEQGAFTEFSLDDGAAVTLLWGDDQATYFGTAHGAIWQIPVSP